MGDLIAPFSQQGDDEQKGNSEVSSPGCMNYRERKHLQIQLMQKKTMALGGEMQGHPAAKESRHLTGYFSQTNFIIGKSGIAGIACYGNSGFNFPLILMSCLVYSLYGIINGFAYSST